MGEACISIAVNLTIDIRLPISIHYLLFFCHLENRFVVIIDTASRPLTIVCVLFCGNVVT